MSTLLIVRTHRADPVSLAAYDRYVGLPGFDVTFVVDERAGPVDMGGRAKTGFDNDKLTAMGLYPHVMAGWRCGDYFYYAAREAHPGYDRYWLIEPDVRIHTDDLAGFFAQFEDVDADFIGLRFGRRSPAWIWSTTVAELYPEVKGCVFSISRMTGPAIDKLYEKRRAISNDEKLASKDYWPNDESFVATTLYGEGFACVDFNDDGRQVYSDESFSNKAPIDPGLFLNTRPDNLVYHPVRDFADWMKRITARIDRMKAVAKRTDAGRLRNMAEALLREPETASAALVPIVRLSAGLENAAWAEDERYTVGAHKILVKASNRLVNRNVRAKPPEEVIATAYAATCAIPASSMRTSSPDDLELIHPIPVKIVPAANSLPYAWDLENRELLCTMHLRPQEVLAAPFLYGAQRDLARAAVKIDLPHLDEIFGAPDRDAAPIFIFSLGRTGSTLFNILLGAAVPRSVSEPDTLTQLAQTRRQWADASAPDKSRLLWHSISAFYRTQLDEPDDGTLAVKLRSQVNALAGDMMQQFPNARYVFITRERQAWARSTYRSFGQPPGAVVQRLKRGIATLGELKNGAAHFHLLSYEGMVGDPEGTVSTIVGRPIDDAVRAKIRAAMATDSQAGTKVDRKRTSQEGAEEDAWLAKFEEQWAADRPAAAIARLGVDL